MLQKPRDLSLVLTAIALQVAFLWVHGARAAFKNGESSPRTCDRDGECDVFRGEECRWLYDGCTRGQCMCPTGEHLDVRNGRCTPRRLGQETCDGREDQCIQGMECLDSLCQCIVGRMTSDRKFCLRHNQQLLGGACRRSKDCFQLGASGYTSSDAECVKGVCACHSGYKQEDLRCRKLNIGERGCTDNDHCYGGALCHDAICKCPPRYVVTSRGTKCARPGARLELSMGDICDEINETGYCARGLICHKCAGERHFKCVKSTSGGYLNGGAIVSPNYKLLFGLNFSMLLLLLLR
ncbi:hypothetical protein LSAT2_016542 [Lamellibrachia satsuma]|nr:hypothetical protein LSAT2_016542 [Lamellibrachia satsuma]